MVKYNQHNRQICDGRHANSIFYRISESLNNQLFVYLNAKLEDWNRFRTDHSQNFSMNTQSTIAWPEIALLASKRKLLLLFPTTFINTNEELYF